MSDDAVSLARRILSEGGYSATPEAVASLASQLSSYSPGYSAPQGTNAAQPAAPAFSSNPGQQAIDAATQQPSDPFGNLDAAHAAFDSHGDPFGNLDAAHAAFAAQNPTMGVLSSQMPMSGIPQGQAHAGFTAGTAFTPDNLVSVPLWEQSGITNPAGRAGATSAPPGVGATGIGSFGLGGPQGEASFQNIADQTAQPGMGPPSQQDINTLAEAGLGEARGQGARGMQDVMSSIVNRADSNYSGFGRNVQQQVDAPSQYSYRGTSNQRAAQQALQGQSPLGKQAQDLAAGLLMGTVPGTVGGRTDYRAQNQGRGVTSTPRADSLVSAGHNFFNNNPALDQLRSQQQQQQNNQVQGQQPAPAPDSGGGFGGGLIPFAPPQAPAGAGVSVPGITGAGASGVGFDGPAPAPPPTPDDSPGIAPGDNSLFGEDPAPPAPSAWDGTGAPQEGGSTPNGAPPPPPDDTPPAPDFSVPAPDLPGPIQGLDPPPPNLGLEAPDAPAPLSGLDPSPPNLGLEAPDAPAPLSGLDAPDAGPSVPGGTAPYAGEDLVSSADMPAPDAVEAQGVGMPGAPDDSAPTASEDDSGDTGSYGSSADSSNDAGDSGGVGGGDSGDSGSGGDDGGDGGGDGGGGDGGGGGDEHRGGRIVAHALQVVRKRRRHGGPTVQELQSLMTEDAVPDTPHNRQTLHDLGQQNYLNGYNSLTPLQQHQYDVLTRSYNFPPQVGSDDTWEDQVSNRNMHLQEGRDPDIEPDSYADGGEVETGDSVEDSPDVTKALELTAPRQNQYKSGFLNWIFGSDETPKIIPIEGSKTFPSENELANSQIYDQSYGDPSSPFFQMEPGAKGQQWNINEAINNINGKFGHADWQGTHNVDLTQQDKDKLETSWIGAQRSPVAALGFDPRKIITTPQQGQSGMNIVGVYSPTNDEIWRYDNGDQSTPVHESIHRGIGALRNADALPDSYTKAFGRDEETAVRALMVRHFGDVEMAPGADLGNKQITYAKAVMNSDNKYSKALDDLESAAATHIAKLRPRGPRAFGGRAHFDLGGEVDPVTDKPDDDPNEIPSFARGGDVDRALGLTRRRARI